MAIWLACLIVACIAIVLWFIGSQVNNRTLRDAGFVVGVLNTPLLAFLLRGTLAIALAFGLFGFLSAPTPAVVSDNAPAFVLDLTPQQAAAYSQGVGASPCSYAGNWCHVGFSTHCPTWLRFTMYYWSGGYLTQVATHYANFSGSSSLAMWAGSSYRTDMIVVDDLGSGCLAGVWLIGVKW